jgi:lantibiotic leader peptide-processing serine protease
MRRLLTFLVVAAALVTLGAPQTATAADKTYLILTKGQGQGSTAIDDLLAAAGGSVVTRMEAIGVVVASSANPRFLARIAKDPRIAQAAEDVQVQWIPREKSAMATGLDPGTQGVNTEPYGSLQWNLRQIHADETAAGGYLGHGVRVAVLDSGIWSGHPDIAPNLNSLKSKSFVPTEPGIDPVVFGFNHGTHVAGIIAAPINDKGIQGVAPEAEIVAVKVLASDTGSGAFSWVIQGIEYAVSINAAIINMSLGATFDRINAGGGGAGPLIAALNRAINHATAAGVFVVSAAGNEGVNLNSRLWSIPAQSGNGVAVSATGPIDFYHLGDSAIFDRAASYTNYGQSVVNVAAPGGDFTLYPNPWYAYDMIISPAGYEYYGDPINGYRYNYYFGAGTSMAAPHVSGLAALIIGKYGPLNPSQIRALIEKSADDILKPGADPYSGKGRINALTALED